MKTEGKSDREASHSRAQNERQGIDIECHAGRHSGRKERTSHDNWCWQRGQNKNVSIQVDGKERLGDITSYLSASEEGRHDHAGTHDHRSAVK